MLRPLHEEGNGNCHRLLLLAALGPSSFGCFVSKNSFAFFFWLLWSCVAAQLHEEGNSNCIADFIFSLLLLMVKFLRINLGGFFFRVVMARGRRLRKSAGGELEMNKENGTASNDANILPNVVVSDEAILLSNITVSDEADVEQHVVAIAEQNMVATNEAIDDQNNVASDQPIGEQNIDVS